VFLLVCSHLVGIFFLLEVILIFLFLYFLVVLVAFCGTSYLEVVKSRDDQLPTKGDFLAALLPLACIPALLSLCCGMVKWWMTISSRCLLNLTLSFNEIVLLNVLWLFFAGRTIVGYSLEVYMFSFQ
jgi:hypothetical protein